MYDAGSVVQSVDSEEEEKIEKHWHYRLTPSRTSQDLP